MRKRETLLPLVPQRYIHSNAKGMKRNSLLKEKKGDTSALSSSEIFHSNANGMKRNSLFNKKNGDTSALNSSEGKNSMSSSLVVWIFAADQLLPVTGNIGKTCRRH